MSATETISVLERTATTYTFRGDVSTGSYQEAIKDEITDFLKGVIVKGENLTQVQRSLSYAKEHGRIPDVDVTTTVKRRTHTVEVRLGSDVPINPEHQVDVAEGLQKIM